VKVPGPASEERVDSRLIKCKTFDGRTLFFPRRKKSDQRTSSVSMINLVSIVPESHRFHALIQHPAHDDPLGDLLEVPLHRLMDQLAAKAADPAVPQECVCEFVKLSVWCLRCTHCVSLS